VQPHDLHVPRDCIDYLPHQPELVPPEVEDVAVRELPGHERQVPKVGTLRPVAPLHAEEFRERMIPQYLVMLEPYEFIARTSRGYVVGFAHVVGHPLHGLGPIARPPHGKYPQHVRPALHLLQFRLGEQRVSEHVLVTQDGHVRREVLVRARVVDGVGRVEGVAQDAGGVVGAAVTLAEDVHGGRGGRGRRRRRDGGEEGRGVGVRRRRPVHPSRGSRVTPDQLSRARNEGREQCDRDERSLP